MSNKVLSYREKRDARRAYAIILPFYTWFFLVIIIPVFLGFGFSFTEWNGLYGLPRFVGLKNFIRFFTEKEYLVLLMRQIWIGGLCLLANTVLSFVVGLLLNVPYRLRGFFRAVIYIPSVVTVTATTAVVVALLDPYAGTLNSLLKLFGLQPIVWTYSTFWMTFWIVAYFVWRSMGPAAIIWLGGLQSIQP